MRARLTAVLRRRRSKPSKPSVRIGTAELPKMCDFFEGIGWTVERFDGWAAVTTSGGRFALIPELMPPRLELALSIADQLELEELAEAVEAAGGLMMEPPQETVWGGWGFTFNDPEGNSWEVGAPLTVTAVDRYMSTGVRPFRDGPVVAVVVPRRRLS